MRERIMDVAEQHFRHIGLRKTTVAEIAKFLGMSSANVYPYFPSRMAINASICGRFFAELVQVAKVAARNRGSAQTKLARILTNLHHKRKTNFVEEKRVHDLMVVAACEDWAISKMMMMKLLGSSSQSLGIEEANYRGFPTPRICAAIN
jgi:AcrR family transcriptional regulator